MKNTKYWLTIGLIFVFSLLTKSALADFEFSYHPSICEAITNQQADRLRWQVDGLKNEDPNMALWVNCPLPLQFWGETLLLIESIVTNESEQLVEVLCDMKWTDGGEIRSMRIVRTVDVGEKGDLVYDVIPGPGNNHLLQCKLPPGVIINQISGYAGTP